MVNHKLNCKSKRLLKLSFSFKSHHTTIDSNQRITSMSHMLSFYTTLVFINLHDMDSSQVLARNLQCTKKNIYLHLKSCPIVGSS